MATLSLIFISLLLSPLALAGNDWNKPCFDGHCSYELTARDGSGVGSMVLSGSPDAISDITPAAGWAILGCSPEAEAQDIRVVCASADQEKCTHLYRSIGPSGKVVRLPENCGKMAFARVAKTWVHDDQRIPFHIVSHLRKRGVPLPEVQGLTLDTDFGAIDASKTGNVTIHVQGMTIPGAGGNMAITQPAYRTHSRIIGRESNFIEDAFASFTAVDHNLTVNLPPVDFKRHFDLIDASVSCPLPGGDFSASISAEMDAKFYAKVQVGVVAQGTLIPPNFEEFGLFAGLDADFSASFNLAASAKSPINSGLVTLFEAGLPGLEFPGIMTVGPNLKVVGRATAHMDTDVDVKLGVSYKADNAQLFFPRSKRQHSGGVFSPGDSPLKLTADTSLASKGDIEAFITPKIEFGIIALKGLAKATVSLDLDASAKLVVSVDGHANAGLTASVAPHSTQSPSPASSQAIPIGSGAPVIGSGAVPSVAVSSQAPPAIGSGAVPVTPPGIGSGAVPTTVPESSPVIGSGAAPTGGPVSSAHIGSGAIPKTSEVPRSSSPIGSGAFVNATAASSSAAAPTSLLSTTIPTSTHASGQLDANLPIPVGDGHRARQIRRSRIMRRAQIEPSVEMLVQRGVDAGASAGIKACVDLGARLDVHASADGDFFGLFNRSTRVNMFNHNFKLYKDCFGTRASTKAKRDVSKPSAQIPSSPQVPDDTTPEPSTPSASAAGDSAAVSPVAPSPSPKVPGDNSTQPPVASRPAPEVPEDSVTIGPAEPTQPAPDSPSETFDPICSIPKLAGLLTIIDLSFQPKP
ncbi:hypothetical protein HGRIS_012052 [Hohenbuehelia grisea]|uniref:Uncharacterized protein n=1 Tax=Hohenbuehelia grisea TaxID=104357 RepID=A0ABR3IR51_9AGAR